MQDGEVKITLHKQLYRDQLEHISKTIRDVLNNYDLDCNIIIKAEVLVNKYSPEYFEKYKTQMKDDCYKIPELVEQLQQVTVVIDSIPEDQISKKRQGPPHSG